MTTVLPDPPRSALVDVRTGQLAREWVLFFDALRRAIVSGLDDSVGGRLDALESDSLFSGSGSETGSNTDYNDAVVRGRLDDLETELLWLATDRAEAEPDPSETETDLSELVMTPDHTADIRRLTRGLAETQLDALMTPDATATIRQLRQRVVDLETAIALVNDSTALIAALSRRLATLETEGLFS